jgi:preprotein translocase subunit SecD
VPPTAGTLRVGPYFASLLALLILLYGVVFWPGERHTPRLGLDLEGGAQVTLVAQTDTGKKPSPSAMRTAQSIIDQRVNGLGVANSTVQIEGGDRIVVSVPGKSSDSLTHVGDAFALNFRPLIVAAVPATFSTDTATPSASASTATSGGATAKPSGSASASPSPAKSAATSSSASSSPSPQGRVVPQLAGTPSATPTASASAAPAPSASGTAAAGVATTVNQWKTLGFAPPKDEAAYNALTADQQAKVQAVLTAWNCDSAQKPVDDVNQPMVTCDAGAVSGSKVQQFKYLLGAVIVQGKEISSATALAPGTTSGDISGNWSINLSLKTTGQQQWAKYTAAHNNSSGTNTDAANTVAYTLDGEVAEAATISTTITGDTLITGSFNASQAKSFANSLKYGALPLNFTAQDVQSVSASLGSSQLKSGLLAGGIGLILVVIYSLLYYRALGLVTIASLLVSGGLTYAMLVILGHQIGFTLTLAGIAGFIVAVGITADSFVVFFERIKDEVHEGRTSRVAIPRAWLRARRTILSADAVSFLAAATLYYFAAGDVRGFAFTLGLSTILDLVVVFLFTHPIVSLFSRSAAFGSARFTGLNHVRVGGVASYRAAPERKRGGRGAKPSAVDPIESDDVLEPDDEAAAPVSFEKDSEPSGANEGREEVTAGSAAPRRSPSPSTGSTAAERAAARRAKQQNAKPGSGDQN